MQWEYKVISMKAKPKSFFGVTADVEPFEAMLNEMGRNKWELVTCEFPVYAGYGRRPGRAVFKRAR